MTLLFDFAGPTIAALFIFLIFYFLRPVFITESNRFFLLIVITEIMGFFTNMLSSYFDNNVSRYHVLIVIFFNNIYYIMYIVRYFLFSLFFSSLLQIKNHKNIFFILVSLVITSVIILVIINPWTEFIYKLLPEGTFHTGEFVGFIYIANLSTVFLDLYYFFISIKRIDFKDRITIFLSIVILLSCCIIDFFFIEYVISDIFFLLVISILFLIFENPEIYYDKKTGILNVQAFTSSITDNLFRHKNYPISGFKINNYNELKKLYGVKQIDYVLKEIGNYLLNNFSKFNCFYLENGKFAFIDKSAKKSSDMEGKIKTRFEQPWNLKNNTSIQPNVTFITLDQNIKFNNYEQIEACVEQGIFDFKNITSKGIVINQQIFEKVLRNTKILKALNKSLLENSLMVYFQPIIDAKSRNTVAAEALVRIYDDELGIIPPVEFISIAEKNGYIEKLGEQVLNKVCQLWHNIDLSEYGIQWINVNLSPIQCQNIDLLENINKIRIINNVKPEHIHLEITEESMIDKNILETQINNIINNGYELSLDDFGSGFSNLYLIKAFPFSNIKLDISLINEHFHSPDNMLPMIVQIFKDRNLSVTAEGVETKEMADELEGMGCDYLQGYYFSKPIPEKDFIAFIKRGDVDNI